MNRLIRSQWSSTLSDDYQRFSIIADWFGRYVGDCVEFEDFRDEDENNVRIYLFKKTKGEV